MQSTTLALIRSKLNGALSRMPSLLQTVSLAWKAAPGWSMTWAGLLIVQGLLPVAIIWLTAQLVTSLVTSSANPGEGSSIRFSLILVGSLGGLILLAELLHAACALVKIAHAEILRDYLSARLHEQSVSADLAFYDWPEYYDRLHRAREEAGYRPAALFDSIGSLFQSLITMAAVGAALMPLGPWLPPVLLLSTLPGFVVVLFYGVRQHKWRLRTTADDRKSWYFDWLLTARETAAEVRLFSLGSHFISAYQTLRQRLRGERLRLGAEQSLMELVAATVALAIVGSVALWEVWRTLHGAMSLGELAFFIQALYQGHRLLRSLLESIGQLYANSLFLGNLFEFLALEPRVVDPDVPAKWSGLENSIGFHDVTFHYPGSKKAALANFNLNIQPGQIAAIVGPNGAGKSTLLKLLCRFYDPDAGTVEMDGIDLRKISLDKLRGSITVLFQEPVHYSATVNENIALGRLIPRPDTKDIQAAAMAAGADSIITGLPARYETLLGRWFDSGTELSTGEWQRLALARAFLRRAQLLLLDEPTSAMDPWAEADWLARFRELAAGRTVIMITHRLSSAMCADIIHVMADGRIVESGRHQELIALGGLYARSWASQNQFAKPGDRAGGGLPFANVA